MSEKIYDSIVIGSGPAGMTAALYMLRAGLKIALVEKGAAGGQILLTAEVDNYPGFPRGIKGWELADVIEAHIQPYMPRKLQTAVESIEIAGEQKIHTIKTGRGDLLAKTVIIASGASHKKLGIDAETKFQGKGVSYCAICDGNFFEDQEIAIVGGGSSALQEALYLSRIVKHVYIIHKENEFRSSQHLENKIKNIENISVLNSCELVDIQGSETIEKALLKNTQTNETTELNVTGIFVFIGLEALNSFVPKEIKMSETGFIQTDCEMRTCADGIFAAGDIRDKRCKQVTTAVGDGATAAMSVISYLEQI